MRVAVIGAGMAGLTAARALLDGGHQVTVLDKGRRPGGRLATRALHGGARADHGAQFFTVRSPEFGSRVSGWLADGVIWEWCRGFGDEDGHPRYAAVGGMAELAGRLAAGLDVACSVHVEAVRPSGAGWEVSWSSGHGGAAGSVTADAVVLTAPVAQSVALVPGLTGAPDLAYTPTLSLLVGLDGPSSVPRPGGIQLPDDPVWSWVADNVAKRVSARPAVTLHTTPEVAADRWDEEPSRLEADLLAAASPWLGGSAVVATSVHRWRYATPVEPHPDRCWVAHGGGIVLAGDAFGGPRVEGAFLSGLAAADAVARGG
jgi:predicted NAD/FAD-dependent oxidoreductase